MNAKMIVKTGFLSVLFVFFIWFLLKYFYVAFPVLNIKIVEDRGAIREKSLELLERYSLCEYMEDSEFSLAIAFRSKPDAQNYIELASNSTFFRQLIDDKTYHFYNWVTRMYQENEKCETWIYFSSELEPIENFHLEGQNVDFETINTTLTSVPFYELGDFIYSTNREEEQIGGRVDHQIIYEHAEIELPEFGKIELKVTYCGKDLCSVFSALRVPEVFEKRYERMRSFNNLLANIANVLFILAGIFFGLFCLISLVRSKYINASFIKWGLLGGFFVSFLVNINKLNQLPDHWMHYDTSVKPSVFLIGFLIRSFTGFIVYGIIFGLILIVGEAICRSVFDGHVQIRKTFWALNTREMLGNVFMTYFYVSWDLFYVSIFYLFMKNFEWWTPTSVLVDPNYFGHYIPCATAVVHSFLAGSVEELAFRALILGGFYYLSTCVKSKGWKMFFVGFGYLFQVFVFSAAHANYPAQPFYARLVELIIPSALFGYQFVKYGLAFPIFVHFAYDLIWFSLTLFQSSSKYSWINRGVIIFFFFFPFVCVGLSSLVQGKFEKKVKEEHLNKSWKVAKKEETEKGKDSKSKVRTIKFGKFHVLAAIMSIIIGVFVVYLFVSTNKPSSEMSLTPDEMREMATKYVSDIDSNFTQFSSVYHSIESGVVENFEETLFLLDEYGEEKYEDALENEFLFPIHAHYRFMIYGEIEEYRLFIINKDVALDAYLMPEHFPGENLTYAEAEAIALREIEALDLGEEVTKVSHNEKKQVRRLDWSFHYKLPDNVSRVEIMIGGDRVKMTYKYIRVPEEYERNRINENEIRGLKTPLVVLVSAAILLLQWGFGIFYVVKKKVSWILFLKFACIMSFSTVVIEVLAFQKAAFNFSPVQPWLLQAGQHAMWKVVGVIFIVLSHSQIAGFSLPGVETLKQKNWTRALFLGVAATLLLFVGSEESLNSILKFVQKRGILRSIKLISIPSVKGSGVLSDLSSFLPVATLSFRAFLEFISSVPGEYFKVMWILEKFPVIGSLMFAVVEVGVMSIEGSYWSLFVYHLVGKTVIRVVVHYIFEKVDVEHVLYRCFFTALLKLILLYLNSNFWLSMVDWVFIFSIFFGACYVFKLMFFAVEKRKVDPDVKEKKD